MEENIYNFDKKFLLINMDITSVQVIIYRELKSNEIIDANQEANWEQMSLFTIICIIASILFPTLIYQNLRNIQINNIGQNIIYFAAIPTS